ncbi:hypothetical protein P7K49_008616 [Saguinus oedipus]|uniref:Syntaxin-7 n=1 Tax=Saguinus oedipus TaxID=9490 RepID=A0ABQ9VY87_SAGOE|nr:hypothetical protein P7K49_008616 [Saguinus oedipus]
MDENERNSVQFMQCQPVLPPPKIGPVMLLLSGHDILTKKIPATKKSTVLKYVSYPYRLICQPVEIQRTLNQLGTPQDSPELRQQLQQKQQYTNQLAKETDKYIKEFGSLPTTPSEQRQRKIQKDRLVAEFTTSLTNFQKVQRQAAEREKEFVARVRASSRVSGSFPEDSSKERNLVSWESQTQPQVQVQDEEITEDDLRLIHERESSIRQLEADIMDINEIFKDLGMMIHEQGDYITGALKVPDVGETWDASAAGSRGQFGWCCSTAGPGTKLTGLGALLLLPTQPAITERLCQQDGAHHSKMEPHCSRVDPR